MEWYWWLIIGWVVAGLLALAMQFRDYPAMRENVGFEELWPVILGPFWLFFKVVQWLIVPAR